MGTSCVELYRRRLDEIGDDDWLEIDPNDDRILQPHRILTLLLKAGDLLLWNSRTVHCSYPGRKEKQRQEETTEPTPPAPHHSRRGLVRTVALVSMMPSFEM